MQYFYRKAIELRSKICYNYLLKDFSDLRKGVVFMSKKGKIILAASISTSVLALTAAAVTVFVCKRIYEKNYFSVTD